MHQTIPVRFTPEMLAEIDAIWEREKPKGMTRSQLLRLLIAEGMKAWAARR